MLGRFELGARGRRVIHLCAERFFRAECADDVVQFAWVHIIVPTIFLVIIFCHVSHFLMGVFQHILLLVISDAIKDVERHLHCGRTCAGSFPSQWGGSRVIGWVRFEGFRLGVCICGRHFRTVGIRSRKVACRYIWC